ncbi:LysR family transcriptional regulator [Rhodococcus sp. HNM0569]|uniref:LysR family transcriptional regulator n=1 Tax=Rhodococcus sp. HNM0569 TaxID=2716340 RepID=UPI001469F392|nr:LysR family transcriptional regulator [Rhodococcus sp. HNM0569]NLU83651.1 LysR family transcriptional regulator [Rhodococcus sp. HNM0569]
MEVRDLRWFLVLAEYEHVTDAAAVVSVGQPTLSRAIGRLERELGVALFDRVHGRVRLNKYGEVFRAHAVRAVGELDSASERIASLVDPSTGTVVLGFTQSYGTWLVPELVAGYKELAPGVDFELHSDAADRVVDDLRHDRVDIAFVSPQPAGNDVVWAELAEEELFVLLPSSHSLARRSEIALTDVAAERFVGLSPEYGLRQIADRLCADAGFAPHWTTTCSELPTLRALVAAGQGISIVPAAHGEQSSRDTVLVRIGGVRARRSIGMLTTAGRPYPPAVQRFRDYVLARAGSAAR